MDPLCVIFGLSADGLEGTCLELARGSKTRLPGLKPNALPDLELAEGNFGICV